MQMTIQQALKAHQESNFKKAITLYDKVLKKEPRNKHAINNIGVALFEQGDLDRAFFMLNRAEDLYPDDLTLLANFAKALLDSYRLDESLEKYEKIIKLEPNNVSALIMAAGVHLAMASYQQAEHYVIRILKQQENLPNAHILYGNLLTLKGHLEAGWREFEWRWQSESFIKDQAISLSGEKWNGASLGNKILLINAEMGVGDTVQYSRFLPILRAQYPDVKIKIVMSPHQIDLFENCMSPLKNTEYIVKTAHSKVQIDYDFYMHFMSLPYLLKLKADDIPEGNYIIASNPKQYKQKEAFVIGLAWHSEAAFYGKARSIALAELAPLVQHKQLQFIDCQYGDKREELKAFKTLTGVDIYHDDSLNQQESLSDFVDQLAACDLIISIDNSTVHLAGAMGKEVWMLLPKAAEYRWLLDTDRSAWYPNMRLFRQSRRGYWQDVIERVNAALVNRLL